MQHNSQTTRRSFLGTLALLSAGTALGSVPRFFKEHNGTTDLERQWACFCKRNGGRLFHRPVQSADKAQVTPCAGHVHTTGPAVYFDRENILAEPTWIYWGTNTNEPADVLVTFFRHETEEKIFRINRYELEGLNLLSPDRDQLKEALLINKTEQVNASPRGTEKLVIRATVRKESHDHLPITHRPASLTISTKYIYKT